MGGRGLVGSWLAYNDDGDPVLTMWCDCGTTTVLTVAGVSTVPVGTEIAVTCDGCLTTRWITVGQVADA